jgi:Nucleotidyltransferase domain
MSKDVGPDMHGLSVEDLPTDLRRRIVARLRGLEPDAVGVLAHGSYARGLATTSSDLDLAVLLDGPGRVHYRTWFEELPDGQLLHVSANTDLTSNVWLSWSQEPQDWAFGFPVTLVHAWVWVTQRAKQLLGDTPILVRPAEVSIEDMVETATRVRRAQEAGDRDGVRFWAGELVRYASPNLVPLNQSVVVHDRREALSALLAMKEVPPHWVERVRICLGLDPSSVEAVFEAATRLALDVLGYVKKHGPNVDTQPWVERFLRDGTFERYLRN